MSNSFFCSLFLLLLCTILQSLVISKSAIPSGMKSVTI